MSSLSIPSTQVAAVLHGKYGEPYVTERHWPVRAPVEGEALVKLEASGICHGDMLARDGTPLGANAAARPLIGGHEGIGRVVALENPPNKPSPFEVGDHVGIGWRAATCGICDVCAKGLDNFCGKQVVNGFNVDGTFQEYVCARIDSLSPIPPTEARATELAPLLCGGATAFAALQRAQVPPNSWLAIAGAAGGVGHLVIQYAKHASLKVVAIDRRSKEKFCKSLGADVFVTYEDGDAMVEAIKEHTSGGVTATIICSAVASAYQQSLAYSRRLASIVAIGPTMISFHTGHLMEKGITLHAQSNGSKSDIQEVLRLAGKGLTPIIEEVSIDQVDQALKRLHAGDVCGRLAIRFD